MDPRTRAVAAYGDVSTATKSPSQVEYQAFARITNALTRSAGRKATDADQGPASSGRAFASLASALHENLRLWTIVQGDVSAEGNALPDQLRASLFYLGEFTRDHTRKVLKGEADPVPLIEINTAVMRGLRQQQEPRQCLA